MIRLRYLGRDLPKKVELPIPYVSKSEKTGEVICNPEGDFPDEDAEQLLALQGLFVRADAPDAIRTAARPVVPPTGLPARKPGTRTFKSKGLAAAYIKKNCPDTGVLRPLGDGSYEVRQIVDPSPSEAEGTVPSPPAEGSATGTTDHPAGPTGEGHAGE